MLKIRLSSRFAPGLTLDNHKSYASVSNAARTILLVRKHVFGVGRTDRAGARRRRSYRPIGESFRDSINGAREGIISFIQSAAQWIEPHRETVICIAAGIAAFGALGAVLVTTGIALQVVTYAMGGFHFVLTAGVRSSDGGPILEIYPRSSKTFVSERFMP